MKEPLPYESSTNSNLEWIFLSLLLPHSVAQLQDLLPSKARGEFGLIRPGLGFGFMEPCFVFEGLSQAWDLGLLGQILGLS